eukprot:2996219-Rhodomonas_salina.1
MEHAARSTRCSTHRAHHTTNQRTPTHTQNTLCPPSPPKTTTKEKERTRLVKHGTQGGGEAVRTVEVDIDAVFAAVVDLIATEGRVAFAADRDAG